MIDSQNPNKLTTLRQGTLTLKPLTECDKLVGIMTLPIKDKNDCEIEILL